MYYFVVFKVVYYVCSFSHCVQEPGAFSHKFIPFELYCVFRAGKLVELIHRNRGMY